MALNEDQMHEPVFSMCLEALKRMNEEIILTKNKAHIHIFKDPQIMIYPHDKVFEVIDDNDTVTIILSLSSLTY
jgi:hypothetical protein